MNFENLRIIIDKRESKSGIPELLKSVGIKIEMKTIPIGDYIVAPETIVERKSIHDFISSVFDGRLFDQCDRLKEHFQFPIILLEGDVDEIEEITENPLIFYGALATIALDFKIPVIPTPNASHSAKLLVSLCSRKDIPKGPFLKKIRKSNNIQKQQLSVLTSLPGIGEKLAKRMLKKFGTPIRVLTASLSELSKVEGLGPSRAKKIKKMLETKKTQTNTSNQKTLHES